MDYSKPRAPRIILLVTFISVIAIIAIAVIATNAVINNWGFYEIFTAIGTTLAIIGGLGVLMLYTGGTATSNKYTHARYPELAMIEADYARSRRMKFPFVSIIIMVVGGIFLAIGLIGIF
ncbi:MAG TPA: hypothetical protein VMX55_01780 [candidate division Zixibacteria bacterium]|nr:hypothetical protein [candidate division Zixibacteria bacterium]